MENFTPVSATIGGLLIGLASTLLLLSIGRIAGISGIVGQLATAGSTDRIWRLAFIVGAPPLWLVTSGEAVPAIDSPIPLLIVGGLLVGFGTRLGGGCTSGHGVCGLGRLSMRSLVATLAFMGVAIVTVYITRHVMGD